MRDESSETVIELEDFALKTLGLPELAHLGHVVLGTVQLANRRQNVLAQRVKAARLENHLIQFYAVQGFDFLVHVLLENLKS